MKTFPECVTQLFNQWVSEQKLCRANIDLGMSMPKSRLDLLWPWSWLIRSCLHHVTGLGEVHTMCCLLFPPPSTGYEKNTLPPPSLQICSLLEAWNARDIRCVYVIVFLLEILVRESDTKYQKEDASNAKTSTVLAKKTSYTPCLGAGDTCRCG